MCDKHKQRKYQITAMLDALTDVIVEVNDNVLNKLNLPKGNIIKLNKKILPNDLRTKN